MKRNHFSIYSICLTLCMLAATAVFFSGCKKDSEPEPETFVSNKARPTWTASPSGDITSSMTAVVKVDLKAQYPSIAADFKMTENDLMAAFIGETCVASAVPEEGLFFLYVDGKEGNVSLKYYSAHYKNIFEAKDAFPFKNDDHLGTVAQPLAPTFVVVK